MTFTVIKAPSHRRADAVLPSRRWRAPVSLLQGCEKEAEDMSGVSEVRVALHTDPMSEPAWFFPPKYFTT